MYLKLYFNDHPGSFLSEGWGKGHSTDVYRHFLYFNERNGSWDGFTKNSKPPVFCCRPVEVGGEVICQGEPLPAFPSPYLSLSFVALIWGNEVYTLRSICLRLLNPKEILTHDIHLVFSYDL